MASVHQFHQGIRRRDAIGEEMLALRRILREAGHDSEIFVGEPVPADLADDVRPVAEIPRDPGSLLLVHHSIGHPFAGRVGSLPGRKALVYHNITPAGFFEGRPDMQAAARRGRRQLRFYRDRTVGALANSRFSAQELLREGYADVRVVPPTCGSLRLARPLRAAAPDLRRPLVLFVGRVAANKRQDDVVGAFEAFATRFAPDAELVLAGDTSSGEPYGRSIEARVAASPRRARIRLAGLVSDDELDELYAKAAVYLSMSEHEGFGVPLLEAFAAGVPVVAFRSSAVPETLGGAGILFSRKRAEEVAALMAEVTFDAPFRQRVIERQLRRLAAPDLQSAPQVFLQTVDSWRGRVASPRGRRPSLRVQIEGPFETTYGLAVANRGLAEAIERHTPHSVTLLPHDGAQAYSPRARDLRRTPVARALWERSARAPAPDVVVRNSYPLRFDRGNSRLQLLWLFWEDSLLPPAWAESIAAAYDGVLAPTDWVRQVLRRSGVDLPCEVVPPVVAAPEAGEAAGRTDAGRAKGARFLSIGSAFPRKGTDVLLRSYFRAFRRDDDVTLTLKTSPNPHNTIARQLEELEARHPAPPKVVVLDGDVEDRDLERLYGAADVLVHPARAEGFGLPPAEAMARGLPVIATAGTGLADFCSDETCFVVPHRWDSSKSHFHVPGAEWMEPDEDALVALLRGFADGSLRPEAGRRARSARERVGRVFSAEAVARRADEAIERLWTRATAPRSVAFVSTANARCGIATYTRYLSGPLKERGTEVSIVANTDYVAVRPDGDDVSRVWCHDEGRYEGVADEVLEREAEIAHVQFHPGLFANYRGLGALVDELADLHLPVFVTFHTTEDSRFEGETQRFEDVAASLARCRGLLVHGGDDAERLAAIGLADRVTRIPHAGSVFRRRDRDALAAALGLSGRRVVASFGFALPHKGFLETIEAVSRLRERFPEVLLLALATRKPEKASIEYVDRCRRRVSELGLQGHVVLLNDFLAEDDLGCLLSSAEVVVLPYGETREGASGAVRFPLGCGRAVVTTRQPMFDDVRDVVWQIPDGRPDSIALGVETVLGDPDLRARLESAAGGWAAAHSWPRAAERHLDLYREGVRNERVTPTSETLSPDPSPRVAVVGRFDSGRLEDQVRARVTEREVLRRLPSARLRFLAPAGEKRALARDGGFCTTALGPWGATRSAEIAAANDIVVVGPAELPATREALAADYGPLGGTLLPDRPEAFFLDGLGESDRGGIPLAWNAITVPPLDERAAERVRRAVSGAAYVSVTDETSLARLAGWGVAAGVALVPDPLVLASRVFSADVLARRVADLRHVGVLPADGGWVVAHGSPDGAAEVSRFLRGEDERQATGWPIVVLHDSPTGTAGLLEEALRKELPGLVSALPAWTTIVDVVALLAHATAVASSSSGVLAIARSFGVSTLPLGMGGREPRHGSAIELDAHFDRLAAVIEGAVARRLARTNGGDTALLRSYRDAERRLAAWERAWEARGRQAAEQRTRLVEALEDARTELSREERESRARSEGAAAELAVLRAEYTRLTHSRLFRWTTPARDAYRSIRRMVGLGTRGRR